MSMTDTPAPPAHSAIRVLAALAELGEATAAEVAEQAGLGYSTTTPKLRAWEDSGQAERRTDDGRTLWRLTPAGRAATAAPTDRHSARDNIAIDAPAPDTGAAEPPAAPAAPAEPIPTDLTAEPEPIAGSDRTDRDDPGDDRSPSGAEGADGTAAAEDTDAVAPTGAELIGRHDAPDIETRAGTEDDVPPDEGADAAPTVDDTDQRNEPPAEPAPPPSGDPAASTGEGEARPVRRTAGSMRAAILDICEAQPDRQFKVGELCRLIDAANAGNAGTGASKASQGAVYNAATKLAAAGTLTQTVEKPATFQLTASSD
jgi:hypothetical protein